MTNIKLYYSLYISMSREEFRNFVKTVEKNFLVKDLLQLERALELKIIAMK